MSRRILYVGGFELPDKNAAAQRVIGNAKALRELGYDVVFLEVNKETTGNEISEVHEIDGFSTFSQRHAQDFKGLLQYSVSPVHVEEILDQQNDWEAVIAYNYPSIALKKLLKICRKKRILCISDCTEWYSLDYLSIKNILIQIDSFYRMRFVQKKLDGIICISHYLEKYYQPYTNTVVIPPLVDIYDKKWNSRNKKKSNVISVVYSGSPGFKKDRLNIIIDALSQIDCIKLSIVGITMEQYSRMYPKDKVKIEKMYSNGTVMFYGRVDHSVSLEYIKNADYTIFYREKTKTTMAGFPTKFVESISCGVPVLTTDTSDLATYITPNKNGTIFGNRSFNKELREFLLNRTSMNIEVENSIFDYRNYVNKMRKIMEIRK